MVFVPNTQQLITNTMNDTWIKIDIEIDNNNHDFEQVIKVSDLISTRYNRLIDESIADKYRKALKACGNKFDMITIVVSRNRGNTYLYEPLYQYRFLGKKDTPNNPDGIEGCAFYNGMFGNFQPCDKSDIVAKIKDYIAKVNSLYIDAIKDNSQQLIAG